MTMISTYMKVESGDGYATLSKKVAKDVCGTEDGAAAKKVEGKIKGANPDAVIPADSVSTVKEWLFGAKNILWGPNQELVLVPVDVCAGTGAAEPKDLGKLGEVKIGAEAVEINLAEPIEVSDKVKIYQASCSQDGMIEITEPKIENGKLVSFKAQAKGNIRPGAVQIEINDENKKIYFGSLEVTLADVVVRTGRRRPPAPDDGSFRRNTDRACNTKEIMLGGMGGHDPASEDCKNVNGQVVWTAR